MPRRWKTPVPSPNRFLGMISRKTRAARLSVECRNDTVLDLPRHSVGVRPLFLRHGTRLAHEYSVFRPVSHTAVFCRVLRVHEVNGSELARGRIVGVTEPLAAFSHLVAFNVLSVG